MAVDLVICVATELEGALLRERLDGSHPAVGIIRTGVGPVNAAHALTMYLATTGARAIVVCGVAGAYPGSGLHVGDVVSAETERYGDLGAASPSGFLDMKALGFPVVEAAKPLFNELPMQLFPVEPRVPFVTVSCCTGTDERRTGARERAPPAPWRAWKAPLSPTSHTCTTCRSAKCAASATSSRIATLQPGN